MSSNNSARLPMRAACDKRLVSQTVTGKAMRLLETRRDFGDGKRAMERSLPD